MTDESSDRVSDRSELERARALARRLREIVAETRADIERMPIFVRPMAKRGFAKRTGRSFDDWDTFARDLSARLQAEPEHEPEPEPIRADITAQLERLLDNYRTAPERAGKFIRDPATMATVRERSLERETVVRDLIAALAELAVYRASRIPS
jgi:hypothetical protein